LRTFELKKSSGQKGEKSDRVGPPQRGGSKSPGRGRRPLKGKLGGEVPKLGEGASTGY